MSRRGDTDTPTRTCVGCGSRDRQSAMVRLRRDAAGTITSDASVRTGRSAYVHGRGECVRGLVRSKVLGKSLRLNLAKEARQHLVRTLEQELARALERQLAGGNPAAVAPQAGH